MAREYNYVSKTLYKWPQKYTNVFLDPDCPLLPSLNSSKLILSFQLIPKPCCLPVNLCVSNLAAACSLKIAYLGIAICNLKLTHKDYPSQAAQTFLLQTSKNTKQTLAGSFGGFLYDSFRYPFG